MCPCIRDERNKAMMLSMYDRKMGRVFLVWMRLKVCVSQYSYQHCVSLSQTLQQTGFIKIYLASAKVMPAIISAKLSTTMHSWLNCNFKDYRSCHTKYHHSLQTQEVLWEQTSKCSPNTAFQRSALNNSHSVQTGLTTILLLQVIVSFTKACKHAIRMHVYKCMRLFFR